MKPVYSFDPYDWATITPLFLVLHEAPISQDSFADWLTRWNELDIAVYDTWTELKRRSYLSAAERAYHVFTREICSTYLGLTDALAARCAPYSRFRYAFIR